SSRPFRVLIAGGGIAGLEAALALRDLAGERVSIAILSPEPDLVYRPMRVVEPFNYPQAQRYSLEAIARNVGAELEPDALNWLDREASIVHTEGDERIPYDALL